LETDTVALSDTMKELLSEVKNNEKIIKDKSPLNAKFLDL
jgi:hypothetical protein